MYYDFETNVGGQMIYNNILSDLQQYVGNIDKETAKDDVIYVVSFVSDGKIKVRKYYQGIESINSLIAGVLFCYEQATKYRQNIFTDELVALNEYGKKADYYNVYDTLKTLLLSHDKHYVRYQLISVNQVLHLLYPNLSNQTFYNFRENIDRVDDDIFIQIYHKDTLYANFDLIQYAYSQKINPILKQKNNHKLESLTYIITPPTSITKQLMDSDVTISKYYMQIPEFYIQNHFDDLVQKYMINHKENVITYSLYWKNSFVGYTQSQETFLDMLRYQIELIADAINKNIYTNDINAINIHTEFMEYLMIIDNLLNKKFLKSLNFPDEHVSSKKIKFSQIIQELYKTLLFSQHKNANMVDAKLTKMYDLLEPSGFLDLEIVIFENKKQNHQ